jgi:EcoRII C terminal/Restriction endonuclease EcoRII, N-terminal
MQSPFCGLAIENATRYGNALLKFVSPNDVGLTGGHQCGFYLPKKVWQMFTPQPPVKDALTKHEVKIQWQDDVVTDSTITWYGQKTRNEYRLTKFGRDFPYLFHDMVGDLLVLIRKNETEFLAYFLDFEEDINELQAALGIEVHRSWGVYREGAEIVIETEDECIERHFRHFAAGLTDFPAGSVFSSEARRALQNCLKRFNRMPSDLALLATMDAEYRLFKLAERQICQPDIIRVFRDVDDFLQTASSILNRRKSRAGRSLENHVEQVLINAGIPHKMRPNIDGKPDVVIPSEEAYRDPAYPADKLVIVGVKTTCKDRWRQVLREGKRVPEKHILTIQQGISTSQLNEMHEANVSLVVPQPLHKKYPKEHNVNLLGVEEFVSTVRQKLN